MAFKEILKKLTHKRVDFASRYYFIEPLVFIPPRNFYLRTARKPKGWQNHNGVAITSNGQTKLFLSAPFIMYNSFFFAIKI